MIKHSDLPRDTNGIIQGAWRVLHRNPDYTGQIGAAIIREGVSVLPVAGKQVGLIAATFGRDLYLEPWDGPLPRGFALPPMVKRDLPESIDWTPEPCPWRTTADALPESEPPPPADEDEGDDQGAGEEPVATPQDEGDDPLELAGKSKDELRAIAEDLGVDVDGRWGEERLRQAIEDAV